MTDKIRIKDVYSQVQVLEEKIDRNRERIEKAVENRRNEIEQLKKEVLEKIADDRTRLNNLEERLQKIMNNEIRHLKIVRLTRKEKVAIFIGILGFISSIIQSILQYLHG
jgi:chromosome segregation ATPase